jgi:hypothetical protein
MTEPTPIPSAPSDPVYRRAEGVVLRKAAGESLLIPVRGKIAQLQNLYVLDGVGESIWNLLAEPKSKPSLADELVRQYGKPKDLLLADCGEFIDELAAEGLVCRT